MLLNDIADRIRESSPGQREGARKFGARHEAFDEVCADDDKKIEALAQRFDSPSDAILQARREAEELVNEHWREIRAVARELMDKGHLNGTEVREAIASARSIQVRTASDRAFDARRSRDQWQALYDAAARKGHMDGWALRSRDQRQALYDAAARNVLGACEG